jgi:hypothetical protein
MQPEAQYNPEALEIAESSPEEGVPTVVEM